MEDHCITRQIQIDADPQRVWDALSDPTEFGAWFHVKLDGPFVVGETTTGKITYPGHEGVPWTTVTEVMGAARAARLSLARLRAWRGRRPRHELDDGQLYTSAARWRHIGHCLGDGLRRGARRSACFTAAR